MQCNQPKIAYLISRYPAVSHTFIQREIEQLRSKGFEIHVASINQPDIASHDFTAANQHAYQETFYVKKQGVLAAIGQTLKLLVTKPLGLLKGISFACRLGGFDIKALTKQGGYLAEAIIVGAWMHKLKLNHLHVHFANPASTVALLLSKIHSITFSLTVHGPDEFYDVSRHHLKEKMAAARFVFCISYFARSQLMLITQPAFWSKLDIVRLGVDPTLYSCTNRNAANVPLNLLCVGRLSPAKGHAILIEALKIVVEQGHVIRLHLVGDGPEKAVLEQDVKHRHLQDNVIFHGALNPQATLKMYDQADIFALASFAEGIPVVLMEAMSKEIPCVATSICGIPELINHEKNGLLVPPSDASAVANALSRLIKDPAFRMQLGQSGRQTILEKYVLDANVDTLASRFRHYLNK